jgi:molybdopterin converting factor small subunit
MARLLLFASARQAAGTASQEFQGCTVDEVLNNAKAQFGSEFAKVLGSCRVWLNGEEAVGATAVVDADEVAVLPPVSGGCL